MDGCNIGQMCLLAHCWRASIPFCLLAHFASAATISGRIVEDHSGSPVASASVRIVKTGVRVLQADLETDGDGRFDAPELTPGDYRIEISKPNYLNATVRLVLTAEETSTNLRLIRCGVITGHVSDGQGQPVRSAIVLAMPKAAGGLPLRPDFSSGHFARADARGNYRIHTLPPGQYAVAVSYGASTFAVGSSGSAATAPGLGSGFLFYPDNTRPQFLNISSGEERRNLDFAIQNLARHNVSGKVDLPTPKDKFWLALSNLDQPALAVAIAQTDADGGFSFSGVSDGSYHLFAARTDGSRNGRGAYLTPEPLFARTRVDIVSQDVADLTIRPEKGRSANLVMRLAKSIGPSAACPAAAQIVLTSLEDWGVQLERRTSMNLEKAETISTLAPARYIVSVTGLGDTCYSSSNPILDLSGTADPGPIVLTVAPAGLIRGHLTTGGQFPSSFVVVLVAEETGDDAPRVEVAVPDPESRFTFGGLRPGRYRIATEPMAKTSQSHWLSDQARVVEITVHGAETTEVNLTAPSPKEP
jgi:hypothetical protein